MKRNGTNFCLRVSELYINVYGLLFRLKMGKDWKSLIASKGNSADADSSDDEEVVVAKTHS